MQHEKMHGFEPFFSPPEKPNHPFVAKGQDPIAFSEVTQPDEDFLRDLPTPSAEIIKIDLTAPISLD